LTRSHARGWPAPPRDGIQGGGSADPTYASCRVLRTRPTPGAASRLCLRRPAQPEVHLGTGEQRERQGGQTPGGGRRDRGRG